MIYSDIIGKVSSELNLPAKLVDRTYRAFWLFINQSIQSLPLKEDIDEEDFAKLKTNFNIPSLGKLTCTYESMLKVKKIKPMFTALITTMNKYEHDVVTEGGLIDTTKQQGGLKEYQTVLAVGDSVRNIKVGDLVCINPTRYAVKQHREGTLKDGIVTDNPVIKYNFDVVEMDGQQCLLLQDRDIDFVVEEWEEVPDPTPSPIIQPDKKRLIV